MSQILIPPSQLQPNDIILGDNTGSKQHRDLVLSRNTILVGGRVSILVSRPTSKRHVRVLYNPQAALLVERENPVEKL